MKTTNLKLLPVPDDDVDEWITETPEDRSDYELVIFDSNGESCQSVDTTREEFIELKRHLAIMRGLIKPEDNSEQFQADAGRRSSTDAD